MHTDVYTSKVEHVMFSLEEKQTHVKVYWTKNANQHFTCQWSANLQNKQIKNTWMQLRNHTKHRRPLPRLRFLKEEVSHVHLQYIHTWAVLQTTTAQKKIIKYKQELNESMPKKATDGSKSGTVEGQCYNRNRSVVPQSDGTCIYHCLQATFNLLFPALLVFSKWQFSAEWLLVNLTPSLPRSQY